MKPVRILHTADLHLDSPFEGLSGSRAVIRRAGQRELPGRIAALAVSEKVDAVLLSGDLFDSDSCYFETGRELMQALERIQAPVFIAPGNHDYYSPDSPYARLALPPNVHVFTSPEVECFDMSDLGFRVYGAAFTEKSSGPMLKNFRATQDSDVVNLLCMHGEVCRSESGSRYNPITPEMLEASGLDYAALGHVHAFSGLQKSGLCYYSQSGCPEGRGFDETGDRTVSIVDISEGGCSITALSVASRRYEIVQADVTGRDPYPAVQMLLPDDTSRDIYRIILTGETESPVNTAVLKAALEDGFFELQIIDNTRIRADFWEKAGDDTLRGRFLAGMKRRMDECEDEPGRRKIEQAARWGIAALDNMEEVAIHDC